MTSPVPQVTIQVPVDLSQVKQTFSDFDPKKEKLKLCTSDATGAVEFQGRHYLRVKKEENVLESEMHKNIGRIVVGALGIGGLLAIAYGMASLAGLGGITNHIQIIGIAALGASGVFVVPLTVYGIWKGHKALFDLLGGFVPFTNLAKAAVR